MASIKSILSISDDYGVKTVTKTDKSKNAYVLNKDQVNVLNVAGIQPFPKKQGKNFIIHILGDNTKITVNATYYHSVRKGSKRVPEARMGTEIIRDWLNVGDELLLITEGKNVYALKLNKDNLSNIFPDKVKRKIIHNLSDELIIKCAKLASKKSYKFISTTEIYYRNPYVIEAAKRRAKGKCEMPSCVYKSFIIENGDLYLEGHHVKPLSEGGYDSINNVAALCPKCHREQHYSKNKLDKRKILLKQLKNIIK